jgi:hypothetical protein
LKRDDPAVDKDGVDKMLWMTEHNTAPVINKLLCTPPEKISQYEFAHLAWFVGFLASRTPFAREQMASIYIALHNRDIKRMLKDEDDFKELIRLNPDTDPAELEKARAAFLDNELELKFGRGGETEDWLMAQQIIMAQEITNIIQQRHLNIIETDNLRVFLTSDNPVITIPVYRDKSPSAFGYMNAHILLPLSPQRALYFTHRPLAPRIIPIKQERMRELQFYIITQCNRFVYSHIMAQEFQRILDKTEEGAVFQVTLPEQ